MHDQGPFSQKPWNLFGLQVNLCLKSETYTPETLWWKEPPFMNIKSMSIKELCKDLRFYYMQNNGFPGAKHFGAFEKWAPGFLNQSYTVPPAWENLWLSASVCHDNSVVWIWSSACKNHESGLSCSVWWKERITIQSKSKLDYPMYAWFLEFFMGFSMDQTSFKCLETCSDIVTCVWYHTSNILQCIHALFKKEHPGRGSLIPSRGKDPCSCCS